MDYIRSIFGLSLSGMMSRDEIRERLQMPYLKAIQALPGDALSEKQRWFTKLALDSRQQDSGDVEQLPAELRPLLRVEIALKEKRHEDIASALKSEDAIMVSKALKATWFFDGSHKKIVDVAYFRELFRYVSINTRMKIVKTAAHQLSGNNEMEFAVEMFQMVESTFGMHQAYPLIKACDKEFIFSTIVLSNFTLPSRIVLKIFEKHADVLIRFLRQHYCGKNSDKYRNVISVYTYACLLPRILKKEPLIFTELYERIDIPLDSLSNTCVNVLLNKCKQQVIRKPSLYMKLIPPAKISNKLIEEVIYNLLPSNISEYSTRDMLCVMSHYPREKAYELLSQSYRNKYGTDLLEDIKNVTSGLLKLLPDEKRIAQARRLLKIEKYSDCFESWYSYSCEHVWLCYLPIDETIPLLKEKMNNATDIERVVYINQMIYSCKINRDDDALLSTLRYFLQRQKNEQFHVFEEVMKFFSRVYKILDLNEELVSVLHDIVHSFYVRHQNTAVPVVELMLHFYLLHDAMDKVTQLIDMLLDISDSEVNSAKFDLLMEYPQYERMCLEVYERRMRERYPPDSWQRDEEENDRPLTNEELQRDDARKKRLRQNLCQFVLAMHDSNDRCKQLILEKRLKPMILDDYAWLKNAIFTILRYKENFFHVTRQLYWKEKELYDSVFSRTVSKTKKADVTTSAVFSLLKRNPQSILDEWEYYLAECKKNYRNANVHRFIKNIRWYKDIPIKFAESCVDDLQGEGESENVKATLTILAFLLHGEPLIKVMDPLIPTTSTVDVKRPDASYYYRVVKGLLWSMKFSNPPVPLEFMLKLCEGDYLQLALVSLINLSRRSSLPKVITVAQKMAEMRVSVRKHGIRLMNIVTSKHELGEFVKRVWSVENNCSIRKVLFETIKNHFLMEPSEATWSIFSATMLTLRPDDENIHSQITRYPNIAEGYLPRYFELWFDTIKALERMGLKQEKITTCIVNYLASLTVPVYNFLPEELAKVILREFLFNKDDSIANAAKNFTILYLLTDDDEKMAMHMTMLSDVFVDTVAKNWNKEDPEQQQFYPIGNQVYQFVRDLVIAYSRRPYDSRIVDHVLRIFMSVLSPTMNAYAYLFLIYAKMLEVNTRNIGVRLGQHMPELIAVFSSRFVPIMSKILIFFIENVFSEEKWIGDVKVSIAAGLAEADDVDSRLMAAEVISSVNQEKLRHSKEYPEVINKLQDMDNPAVISVLNAYRCQSYLSVRPTSPLMTAHEFFLNKSRRFV